MDERDLPVFAGICRRFSRKGGTSDLLGVSMGISFPFFPQPLAGLFCVIGARRDLIAEGAPQPYKFRFTTDDGSTAWIDFGLTLCNPTANEIISSRLANFDHSSTHETQLLESSGEFEDVRGTMELVATPMPRLMLMKPGRVHVEIEADGATYPRGEIWCTFKAPPPLGDEERRAIASRPSAFQEIQYSLKCAKCSRVVDYVLPLDPHSARDNPATRTATPLLETGDEYACSCGRSRVDLRYLKAGLHEVFRHPPSSSTVFTKFTPVFEAGRIESILAAYETLIETSTDEEPIQKFLESHSIFWSFLSPARILHKPAVLTKKKADFGILSSQGVLYFVEIEKPHTRLLNRDGSISADIQRGVNQIKDWDLVVADHKTALLSELGLRPDDVQDIQYILIGGLARKATIEGLTKLRRSPLANKTQFHCFDELGSFVHFLSGELRRL